jgi:chromosome partitioning protein
MITVIGNLKGGSGKSTVTFNLALWLIQAGKNVLVYDLDPQATLSDAVQVRQEENYQPTLSVLTHLKKPQSNHQEVLIDVGAANMAGMKEAASIADRIVVPVLPGQADIWSTQRFLNLIINDFKIKPLPQVLAFINRADTHIGIHESDEAEQALSNLPGIKVINSRLCQRVVYRRSFSEGLAVFELEPSNKAVAEFEQLAKQLYSQPNSKPKPKRKK